jgi:hypothetical protein
VLRLLCTGTAELDAALGTLKERAGVVDTQTRLLLHRIPDLHRRGRSLESSAPERY